MRAARLWLLVLGSAGPSLSAYAGLVVTESRTTEAQKGQSTHSVMRMSLQGEQARTDMLEFSQPNPMINAGDYMLMTAGKSEVIIVNPTDKTYMRMDSRDFRGFSQMAGKAEESQQAQGGGQFMTDLKVEKTTDEAGPTMLGLPTRHVVYSITYQQPIGLQNQPMKMHSDVKETRELWVTHGLDSSAGSMADFHAFAERSGGMSGSMAQLTEVDKQIAAEGFVLKSVRTSESKMAMPTGLAVLNPAILLARGKGGSSRTLMEVTEVKQSELPADAFVLPKGYTERQMMNPNAGAMPDLNQIPGSHAPQGGQSGQATSQMPDLNNMPH